MPKSIATATIGVLLWPAGVLITGDKTADRLA
jgi:hypothetical protein